MGAFGDLVVTIAIVLLAFLWIYCVMDWMVEGEISGTTGIVTIVASVLMVGVGISAQSEVVSYSVMLLFLVAPLTLPLINLLSGQASDRELDLQSFERAHGAFAANPANVGSRFEIARQLAKLGLYGHAIAIGRGAEALLTDDQGSHQRGTRLMFGKELSDCRYWESLAKPEDYRNVRCPHCSRPNPPGTIACLKCNAPFLLDIVRKGTNTRHLGSKIVLVWLSFAGIVATAAILGSRGEGWMTLFSIGLLVLAVGGFSSWLVKDRIKFS
jgi:hypothetical protein